MAQFNVSITGKGTKEEIAASLFKLADDISQGDLIKVFEDDGPWDYDHVLTMEFEKVD